MENQSVYIQTLKLLLKKKKLTYEQVASSLGMTESGVKKMLNTKDISLTRLQQILKLLGIGLTQFAQMCEQKNIKLVQLTAKQENYLIQNKLGLNIYWRFAVEKKTIQQISQFEKIDEKQILLILEKLYLLGLIKKTKKSYARLHEEKFRFDESSTFVQALNKNWSELTLARSLQKSTNHFQRLVTTQISTSSYQRFLKKFEDLVQELALQSQQDEINVPNQDLQSLTALLCLIDSGVLDSRI